MYFTKVAFHKGPICIFYPQSTILLNLPERELSYQKFNCRYTQMPDCFVSNDRNHFTPTLLPDDSKQLVVQYSYARQLTEDQMRQILPLCVVEDFEDCRHWQKNNETDYEFQGFEDERVMWFQGTSDSTHPVFKLPMHESCNEIFVGPCERLYFHLYGLLQKTACGRHM